MFQHLTLKERKCVERPIEALYPKRDALRQALTIQENKVRSSALSEPEFHRKYFSETLFQQYHPEIREWLEHPLVVSDPTDCALAIVLGSAPDTTIGVPKTNLMRFQDLQQLWNTRLIQETKEYKKWQSVKSKVFKLQSQLSNLEKEEQEYRRIEAITATEAKMDDRLLPFLNRVLGKSISSEKGKKRQRSSEGIKGLLLPFPSETLKITQSSQLFGYEGAFEITGKKQKPVAVLLPDGTLYIRRRQNDDDTVKWLIDALHRLARNPKEFLSVEGKTCGMCLLCGRMLTDETSKQVGFGSVCAKSVSFLSETD